MNDPYDERPDMKDGSTTWWAPVPRSLRNPDIKANDRSVFLALSWRMNWDTGRCYPSIATIAEDANISVTATKESLRRLEEHGFLTRTRRKAAKGGYTSTEYTLHMQGVGRQATKGWSSGGH